MSVVRKMLEQNVWAVIGVSEDRSKFGYKVYKRLKDAGYKVYPVNPKLTELDGEPVYPDVASLPEVPDVVNFVVPPAVTAGIIPECAARGIKYLWMQPGADSREALNLAKQNKMEAKRACVLTEIRHG